MKKAHLRHRIGGCGVWCMMLCDGGFDRVDCGIFDVVARWCFYVSRYVWELVASFKAQGNKKASLVKGRGTACGGGIGKKGVQSLRRSAPAPFDKGAFGWAVLKDEGFHDGCVGWLRSAGASPRPTGNGVPSSCCCTGKLLDEERETHPELRVKGHYAPCSGVWDLNKVPRRFGAAPLRKVWDLNKVPRRVRGQRS